MSTSISKTLGSVTGWIGKRTFLTLVISLILTATLISVADPNIQDIYLNQNESETSTLKIEGTQEIYFIIFSTEGERFDLLIEQLIFQDTLTNETVNFEDDNTIVSERIDIVSTNVREYDRMIELETGTYEITITMEENGTVIFSYFNFNLGLIVATALAWVLFSLLLAAFFVVLPFWIFTAIMASISGSSNDRDLKGQSIPQQVQPQRGQEANSNEYNVERGNHPHSRPSFTKGTQFEKLTRKDLGLLVLSGIFFFAYLTNPFDNGFLLFLSVVIVIGVIYNYTEREKTKDRIKILLNSYPKSSIAFVAEQLDKKEDYIVDVIRIMILDEGHPIRLDLINRSIVKVGEFIDEPQIYQAATSMAGPVQQESESEPVSAPQSENIENTTSNPEPETPEVAEEQIKRGDRGQVTEPWAYCQQCGEALVQKMKYCFVCGSRVDK